MHLEESFLHDPDELVGQIVGVVDQLGRPGLVQDSFELVQAIHNAHCYLVGAHLQQRVRVNLIKSAQGQQIVWHVQGLVLDLACVSAFGQYLSYLSIYGLLRFPPFLLVLGNPRLHLVWGLHLFNHHSLEPKLN